MTDEQATIGALQAEVAALRARIAEMEQTERTLRDELRHAQRITELTPAMIYLFDFVEQRGMYINGGLAALLGCTPEELQELGANVVPTVVHPDDMARVHAYFAQFPHARDGDVLSLEYRLKDFHGNVRWVHDRTTIFSREPNGAPRITLGLLEDITERKLAEEERRRSAEERAALQAQVIEAQQATLRELGAPLIPIAKGTLAMPLVGRIDDARAQQLVEVLLNGIAAQQATTAILDITGVRGADARVADALVRAARAVRLLGAEVVLTGIGPEVAQNLVALGVDLRGVVTSGTFESGIAYALSRSPKR